jgi:CMP-N-acetylneuraminic acid synthetase
MIDDRTVIAIIPARGGSKGLPRKNILPMCGKPLIAWSIEKALKSKFIDIVLVSTDDNEISNIAIKYGAEVPFIRPYELASDTATSYSVVEHALDFYQNNYNRKFYYSILLEPTSPLREDDDIDLMLEKLNKFHNTYDSIISMGESREHPSIIKKIIGNNYSQYCTELLQTTRRQDNEKAYFPYGVAYITKTQSLLIEKTFYTQRSTYHLIKRYQNYEIDDFLDFLCVEKIMSAQWGLL